jgi:hypothetical protein
MSRNLPGMGRMEMKGTETVVYPGRSHLALKIETPMGELDVTRVVDGDSGWMRQPSPQNPMESAVAPIPTAQLAQSKQDRRTDMLVMLSRLARGEFRAVKDGEALKVLDGESPVATLGLGADGLVKTVTFTSATTKAESVRSITEYKEKDGVRYPAAWEVKDGQSDPEFKVVNLEWNPTVDDAIFAKPKEEKKEGQ